MFDHGGLKPGWEDEADKAENAKKRVLITAGAGGVGVWALQLARAAGVKDIVTITSTNNVELVRSLGATEVIDYKQQSLGAWTEANGRKFDLVFDMLGGKTLADSWLAVKDNGILLGIRENPATQKPTGNVSNNVLASFFIMDPEKGFQLKEIAHLVEANIAKPIVDSVYALDQFKEAFSKLESGHVRGKVIIEIRT